MFGASCPRLSGAFAYRAWSKQAEDLALIDVEGKPLIVFFQLEFHACETSTG